jgi:hypothetical protein
VGSSREVQPGSRDGMSARPVDPATNVAPVRYGRLLKHCYRVTRGGSHGRPGGLQGKAHLEPPLNSSAFGNASRTCAVLLHEGRTSPMLFMARLCRLAEYTTRPRPKPQMRAEPTHGVSATSYFAASLRRRFRAWRVIPRLKAAIAWLPFARRIASPMRRSSACLRVGSCSEKETNPCSP